MDEESLNRKLYNEDAKREWARLLKDPFHRLELDTTLYFLKKYYDILKHYLNDSLHYLNHVPYFNFYCNKKIW